MASEEENKTHLSSDDEEAKEQATGSNNNSDPDDEDEEDDDKSDSEDNDRGEGSGKLSLASFLFGNVDENGQLVDDFFDPVSHPIRLLTSDQLNRT
jgi:hypothetical protein